MSNNVLPRAREITTHRVNGLNESLRVFVLDAPGPGGACHDYIILRPMDAHDEACYDRNGLQPAVTNPMESYRIHAQKAGDGEVSGLDLQVLTRDDVAALVSFDTGASTCDGPVTNTDYFNYTRIHFQNGPIKENGVNGLSQEALIAVLIDRLEGFQSGPFKCHDNEVALDHLQGSRLWLAKRTMDRVARNVEGTPQA